MLDTLALWLATYALHSTLLLGSAWLLARAFPAARERLWRLALFGGLVTASLHTGGFLRQVAYLELPGLAPAERESAQPAQPARAGAPLPAPSEQAASAPVQTARHTAYADARPVALDRKREQERRTRSRFSDRLVDRVAVGSMERSASGTIDAGAATIGDITMAASRSRAWWPAATIAWLVVLAPSLAAHFGRAARFRWRFLANRRAAHGEPRRLLSGLAQRAGFRRHVRLSLTDAARVPMARGWLRPEICLPPALEDQLEPEELEAALAHELAHLERRDPLWRAVTRLIASVLLFQPLNRLACRALEDEAELRCDDRAAALTGRPAALARCLTRVASWSAVDRGPTPLPALAANRGSLRRRVVRLLDDRARSTSSRWVQAIAVIPPTLVLTLAPGLGAAPAPGDCSTAATKVTPPSSSAPLSQSSGRAESQRAHHPPIVHRLDLPTFGWASLESPAEPAEALAPAAAAAPAAVPAAPADPAAAAAPGAPAAPAAPAEPAVPAPAALPAAPAPPAAPSVAAAPAPPADENDDSYDDEDHEPDYDQDEDEEAAIEAEAERLDQVAEEVDRLMEDLDGRIETVVAEFESLFEQELDAVADEIDGQVDSFDEEIERSLAPLEEALEELGEELEEATAEGNQARVEMLERQMGEIGAAMGDLGSRLGSLVSRSALTGVDRHLQKLAELQSETIEVYARRQAEIGQRLMSEIEERQKSGRRLDDEEVESLAAELEQIAEEAAPHYEELDRQVEELTRQLEPTRVQMRTLSVELRREVDAWRKRHAELLRELEEDGVTVPSYDDQPEAAEPQADPQAAPVEDPDLVY